MILLLLYKDKSDFNVNVNLFKKFCIQYQIEIKNCKKNQFSIKKKKKINKKNHFQRLHIH